jgi:hypothetical protein
MICPTAQAKWLRQIGTTGKLRIAAMCERADGRVALQDSQKWARDGVEVGLLSSINPTLIVEFWRWRESGMPDPRPSCAKSIRAVRLA